MSGSLLATGLSQSVSHAAPYLLSTDPAVQNLKNGACTPPATLTTSDIQNIAANVQPGVNYNANANSGGEASLDASNMIANGSSILGAAYGAQVMPLLGFGEGSGAFTGDHQLRAQSERGIRNLPDLPAPPFRARNTHQGQRDPSGLRWPSLRLSRTG